MGRLSKVELYNLLERVVDLHREHKTIKDIEAILRDEGYDISRESIRRSIKSSREAAAEYEKAFEESKAILEAVRNNPNTDTYEAILSLMAGKLLAATKEIDAIEFDDPNKMVEAIGRLAGSQARIGKLRMDYQKGYEAAKREFLAALNAELRSSHPALLAQLTAVVAQMEAGA